MKLHQDNYAAAALVRTLVREQARLFPVRFKCFPVWPDSTCQEWLGTGVCSDGCSSHPSPRQDGAHSSHPSAISIIPATLPALGLRAAPAPSLAAACSSPLPALDAELAITHRSWWEIRAELAPYILGRAEHRWGHRDIPAHGSPWKKSPAHKAKAGRSWVPKIPHHHHTTQGLTCGAEEEEEEEHGWHQGERQQPDVRPPRPMPAVRTGTESHRCTVVLPQMGVWRWLCLKHATAVSGGGQESLCPTKGHTGPANQSLLGTCWSSDQETCEKFFRLDLLRTRDIFLSGKMKLQGRTPPMRQTWKQQEPQGWAAVQAGWTSNPTGHLNAEPRSSHAGSSAPKTFREPCCLHPRGACPSVTSAGGYEHSSTHIAHTPCHTRAKRGTQ